ncbi:MAG: glycosyltransferase family 4 protein [Solirubrobacteraceae bacterium]
MAIALLTTYLAGYRMALYERLAERHGVEILCYGRGERYVPPWFLDLDSQLAEAPFPARRLAGPADAFTLAQRYEAVIAPFAGGEMLPAAYAGARVHGRPFVLWASVWAQPRSLTHAIALPITRHIYRNADAVLAYGEHVRRFVAALRGRDDDVFVAPQCVEPELFRREVSPAEVVRFRAGHGLGSDPLALYVGRLVSEKGVDVLAVAWPLVVRDLAARGAGAATLVLIGDGPLAERFAGLPNVRLLGPMPRPELPVAYAASEFALLPSVPTPRFREPWGLVCNEAMHQGRPMIATPAVGAVAGGLVRDGDTGVLVAPADAHALAHAAADLLGDRPRRERLGASARLAADPYTPDAMADAFERALATAMSPSPTGP